MATVTISLEDLDAFRTQIKKLEDQITGLKDKLHKAEVQDPSGRIPTLLQGLSKAADLVAYAVANLPPETSPGWPYKTLEGFGAILRSTAGLEHKYQDLGVEFQVRSREIEPFEVWRAAQPKTAMPALPSDFGPQTDEAREIHNARKSS